MKNIDIKYIDRRTSKRYIDQGLLSKEDLNKAIESLPDLTSEAEVVNFDLIDNPLPDLKALPSFEEVEEDDGGEVESV